MLTYISSLHLHKALIPTEIFNSKIFPARLKNAKFCQHYNNIERHQFSRHQTCEENGDLSKLTWFECKSTIR